jgi:hypothetical protein
MVVKAVSVEYLAHELDTTVGVAITKLNFAS